MQPRSGVCQPTANQSLRSILRIGASSAKASPRRDKAGGSLIQIDPQMLFAACLCRGVREDAARFCARFCARINQSKTQENPP